MITYWVAAGYAFGAWCFGLILGAFLRHIHE